MTQPPVSVVIVSRDRPGSLDKTLRALKFQRDALFEVIVVCDPATAKQIDGTQLKLAILDEANISRSRNIGVALAAGDVVAFIDDDAIPEPTWLARLTAPFSDPNVAASGGFVRGRNGISFQWKAEEIGRDGATSPIEVTETTVLKATPSRAIKTQGTNCAFRRNLLCDLGGFDESYRFYLDETDLNVRLGMAGHLTAIVPGAEVQHGYAASMFRGADRRPRSVFEIAASQAHYCKTHGVPDAQLDKFMADQHARIERAFVAGQLEPRDVRRLRAELVGGLADGAQRDVQLKRAWEAAPAFKPYGTTPSEHVYIKSRLLSRRIAFNTARARVADGQACTVILLSLTALYHRRYFHPDGFWVQSGGIFGKSSRSDAVFKWYSTDARFKRERDFLKATR